MLHRRSPGEGDLDCGCQCPDVLPGWSDCLHGSKRARNTPQLYTAVSHKPLFPSAFTPLPWQDGHGMLGEFAAREGGVRIMHALKHSQLLRRKLQGAPKVMDGTGCWRQHLDRWVEPLMQAAAAAPRGTTLQCGSPAAEQARKTCPPLAPPAWCRIFGDGAHRAADRRLPGGAPGRAAGEAGWL